MPFISRFHKKILAQEAAGGEAVTLNIVIPTITRPGVPFLLKASLLDNNGYPSVVSKGVLSVKLPKGGECTLNIKKDEPAVGVVKIPANMALGLFRLEADFEGLCAVSNPSLCIDGGPQIFWGDPHVHTVLSDCHPQQCRSTNFCYTAARYLSGLDWVAATDHVSNNRCEFARWKEQKNVSELYNDPPDFVTLPAYEASLKGGQGGDNNVYMKSFPEMFVDEYDTGNVRTLCDRLDNVLLPGNFFVVPHHTTRINKHGEISDSIYPGVDRMPAIEIHSKWGTSEYRGNPNALHEIHDGPSYAQDFLARGIRLGFIAGTDSHATMPAGGGIESTVKLDRHPGMTAVWAPSLSRENIFEAIKSRHCYAATLERILFYGAVAGCQLGEFSELMPLPKVVTIELAIAARSNLARVEIIRNGEVIHTETPNDWRTELSFKDDGHDGAVIHDLNGQRLIYYYVRATCSSGAQAWTSPLWFLA